MLWVWVLYFDDGGRQAAVRVQATSLSEAQLAVAEEGKQVFAAWLDVCHPASENNRAAADGRNPFLCSHRFGLAVEYARSL